MADNPILSNELEPQNNDDGSTLLYITGYNINVVTPTTQKGKK